MPPQVVYSDGLPIGIPIPPILVAEAENALAIGDHNHFTLWFGTFCGMSSRLWRFW